MIHVLLASRAGEETKRDARADPSAKGRVTRHGAARDGGLKKNRSTHFLDIFCSQQAL
jgi:hypothetical protein